MAEPVFAEIPEQDRNLIGARLEEGRQLDASRWGFAVEGRLLTQAVGAARKQIDAHTPKEEEDDSWR